MNYRKHEHARFWRHLLTAPFIWSPLPFAIMLDIVVSVYQAVAFPVYGLKKLKRADYILIMDRSKLDYLSGLEKFNCMYCGYMNGLFNYLKEIGALTEKYWCGIMHERKPGFKKQAHQADQDFAKFNDRGDFEQKYPER